MLIEVCSRLGSQEINRNRSGRRCNQGSRKTSECFGEKVTIVRSNYCDMKQQLQKLGIDKVDGITVDPGVHRIS